MTGHKRDKQQSLFELFADPQHSIIDQTLRTYEHPDKWVNRLVLGDSLVVKNAGLGFALPYLHNGQTHDYVPDFIVRLRTDPPRHLVLETKGFDPLEEVKVAAARRWVAAVNADRRYGSWAYAIAKRVADVEGALTRAAQ